MTKIPKKQKKIVREIWVKLEQLDSECLIDLRGFIRTILELREVGY